MRKLRRSIARANMKKAGITKINKKILGRKDEKKKSFFSLHWRDYV